MCNFKASGVTSPSGAEASDDVYCQLHEGHVPAIQTGSSAPPMSLAINAGYGVVAGFFLVATIVRKLVLATTSEEGLLSSGTD